MSRAIPPDSSAHERPGPPQNTRRARATGHVFAILSLALFAVALLDIWMGDPATTHLVSPVRVIRVIGHHVPILSHYVAPLPQRLQAVDVIVWDLRVPRACAGALVGMLLALAGVAFQSLLMNPLADPYMVGVSAGSALGSVTLILFGGAGLLAGFAQPLAAFVSGLLTMMLVYALARVHGRVSAQTFLLAGVVIGTFLWSLIPLALSLANRSGNMDRQSAILSQLLGNLQYMDWRHVLLLAPFGAVGAIVLWQARSDLNQMAQGEESAAHLGVDIEACKRRVIVAGSLVTAAWVSVAGIVAFVGLVVPHLARRLVGPKHEHLLPAAMLLGGIVLVAADWLSRAFLNQLEVGVITSLLGAPMFCYLLRRQAMLKD